MVQPPCACMHMLVQTGWLVGQLARSRSPVVVNCDLYNSKLIIIKNMPGKTFYLQYCNCALASESFPFSPVPGPHTSEYGLMAICSMHANESTCKYGICVICKQINSPFAPSAVVENLLETHCGCCCKPQPHEGFSLRVMKLQVFNQFDHFPQECLYRGQ